MLQLSDEISCLSIFRGHQTKLAWYTCIIDKIHNFASLVHCGLLSYMENLPCLLCLLDILNSKCYRCRQRAWKQFAILGIDSLLAVKLFLEMQAQCLPATTGVLNERTPARSVNPQWLKFQLFQCPQLFPSPMSSVVPWPKYNQIQSNTSKCLEMSLAQRKDC